MKKIFLAFLISQFGVMSAGASTADSVSIDTNCVGQLTGFVFATPAQLIELCSVKKSTKN